MTNFKTLLADLKREMLVYRRVTQHKRTPRSAKILLGAATGYLLLPFDLIPDMIPVIGQLDDLVIVPGLLWLALRQIPPDVIEECRATVAAELNGQKELNHTGTENTEKNKTS